MQKLEKEWACGTGGAARLARGGRHKDSKHCKTETTDSQLAVRMYLLLVRVLRLGLQATITQRATGLVLPVLPPPEDSPPPLLLCWSAAPTGSHSS